MNSEQVAVDPSTVFFDLQTLEFQTNHSSSNSDVSDQETIIYDEFMDNNDSDNGDSSDDDNSGDDFYEIDTDSDNEELLSYPITNMPMTLFVNDLPELLHYDQDDELSDWNYEQIDSGPSGVLFVAIHAQTYKIYMANLKYFSMDYLMTGCGQF